MLGTQKTAERLDVRRLRSRSAAHHPNADGPRSDIRVRIVGDRQALIGELLQPPGSVAR